MASIDKTYVTKEQYKEIKLWWIKTKKKQIRDLGSTIWLYPLSLLEDYSEDIDNPKILGNDESNAEFNLLPDGDFTLWNTSITTDMWLYKNCPFEYIKEKMKDNIGELHEFVNDFKFGKSKGVWIASIKTKKSNIYFFKNIDENYIEVIDNIIVYGTTDLLKIIDNAKNNIKGIYHVRKTNDYEILFEFNGIPILYKNSKCLAKKDNKEIEISLGYVGDNFHKIKIKHSYNLKDSKKYKHDEQIFLSFGEDDCCDITQYKNHEYGDRDLIKRYVSFLPEYIRERIKKD